jgi:hypothetical protein
MNWTGGSLHRTKNANKGVVQKQKAYFARVRTHLQNGSKPLAMPFRPSYLQNDESFELVRHLSSFTIGSVRHIGHLARCRADATQQVPSLKDHTLPRRQHRTNVFLNNPPEIFHGDAMGMKCSDTLVTEQRKKRKSRDTDLEMQLLKANKKRLLGQTDWTGVAPSRALHLRSLSSKEKSRVGKRTNVEGKYGMPLRHRDEASVQAQRLQPIGYQHTGVSTNGAIRYHPRDLCIRIGTDALTSACLTEPNDYGQSHVLSDPMLFDQQILAPERMYVRETATSTKCEDTPLHLTSPNKNTASYGIRLSERAQLSHWVHNRPAAIFSHENLELSSLEREQTVSNSTPASPKNKVLASVDTTPGPGITQYVEGNKYPLHLAFGTSSTTVDARSRVTADKDSNSGPGYAPAANYAGVAEMGNMHIGDESEHQSESEAAPAVNIVDDKPWQLFLEAPGNSSSHTTPGNASKKSITHRRATTQDHEAECTSWSQRATRGGQTHISSSVTSASSPFPGRDARMRVSAHDQTKRLNQGRETTLRILDEDERLWQEFVFGKDQALSSDTACVVEERSDQSTLEPLPRVRPLSVAVSSVSSVPFRAIPERAPCVSDNRHDAAGFAPQLRLRGMNAPVAVPADLIEQLSDEGLGDITAEPTPFSEDYVTHTSLLNNASCGSHLISTRMFSHVETSRTDLDYPGCREDGWLDTAYMKSSESERFERVSVNDIPDSDEDGLDLIDTDKMS